MSNDNIIKICRAIGRECTYEHADAIRNAAYSMMKVEVLARNEQIIDKEGPVLRYLLDPNGNKEICSF